MAVGIFAGIPVNDYDVAVEWYTRLLRSEPTFYPNDTEAVWQLADDCHVYIIQAPHRAGGGVNMIWVDDPKSVVSERAAQGIQQLDVEKHDGVWKYVFNDADGNEIGIGGEMASP